MSAIFISYTARDAEGRALAERVVEWLREWGYQSLFRDKDLQEGIPAGADWRGILHATLARCQAMVSVCSPSYRESEWCIAEVAVALDRGKTVFPMQVGDTELPLLLRNRQVIALEDLIVVTAEAETEAKERLRRGLQRRLSWRDRMPLPPSNLGPFPGLKAYDERHAALFFGRDAELYRALDKVQSLEGGSEFLLLYGASGCGKSSLLKAGLVPELRRVAGDGLLVVDPFRPDSEPLKNLASHLQGAMERDGLASSFTAQGTVAELVRELNNWRRHKQCQGARVLVPVDQFEDVFRPHKPTEEQPESEGDRFLAFLRELMQSEGRVLVVATMRTDFLAVLEAHASYDAGLRWHEFKLEPMRPAFYGEVIEGPCRRFPLELPAGLKELMVADTGSGDALPLLAFTLQAMWQKGVRRRDGDGPPDPDRAVKFLLDDYTAIGTVEGSVRAAAEKVEKICTPEQLAALREAFLDHLLRWNEEGEGQVAKQKALRTALPPASLPVIERMIDRDRLLVADAGTVEIAHEALMRTWPTLERWIAEGKGALLQRLRVRRLADDLKPESPARQRRQALEQLAALAAEGGSEQRAVRMEATQPLSALLAWVAAVGAGSEQAVMVSVADKEDAALVLALIGAEEPLRACLADRKAPPALQRRAAESLGLLAKHSANRDQRKRISDELEGLLRGDAIDLVIADDDGWAEHDKQLPLLQGAARGLQLAMSAELPPLSTGPGLEVPMLTIMGLKENGGLRILTDVVDKQVWKLPLPGDSFIEFALVPGGRYSIGSPPGEHGRDSYWEFKPDCTKLDDIEPKLYVTIPDIWIARHPITQSQWISIDLKSKDASMPVSHSFFRPQSCWEKYAEKGSLPVDSITYAQARQYVQALNEWIAAGISLAPSSSYSLECYIPTEAIWEIACRSKSITPFHFGDTIDWLWANMDFSQAYGVGRTGTTRNRTSTVGSYGLVNAWGISDMHGQVLEWCSDVWRKRPVQEDDCSRMPWLDNHIHDSCFSANHVLDENRVLRGGSWFDFPLHGRSAFRDSILPGNVEYMRGLRPIIMRWPRKTMSK